MNKTLACARRAARDTTLTCPLRLAPGRARKQPQNEYVELHQKRYGRRLDHEERKRKREARVVHERARQARAASKIKAKLLNKRRHAEKIQMKKKIAMHQEKKRRKRRRGEEAVDDGDAVPAYLMDREDEHHAKVLTNMIKQKRKEKAGKWDVPLPKVRAVGEAEVMRVLRTGKSRRKAWKRMITKHTFVGPGFTRKPPKFERFIRPMALRVKRAHVTHPEVRLSGRDVLGGGLMLGLGLGVHNLSYVLRASHRSCAWRSSRPHSVSRLLE